MAWNFRPAWTLPPGGAAATALCLVYLLAGTIGHDPWKPEDAAHFGITFAMLGSGHWWVPQLAGEPLPGTAPLYYWVSIAFARLFGWALPLHDAARLASVFFAAMLLAATGACARALDGAGSGTIAVLLAIGCIGLVVPVHESQPAIALLAATALALLAAARLPAHPAGSAALASVSIAMGVLAQGWPALALLAPLPALPALTNAAARRLPALLAAALAPVGAAGLAVAWPLALSAADPALADAWRERLALGLATAGFSAARLGGILAQLPWFAWPAAPLALWTLWCRRKALADASVALPLGATLWFAFVLAYIDTARSLAALPLLVPLVLLAVPAATTLRRGAANALDWFGMMTFTLLAGLAWLGWVAMSFGVPARLARQVLRLEPGFVMTVSPWWTGAAVAMSASWLWLLVALPRHRARAVVRWAAGMTAFWTLLMLLWMPWIDYGKSYRAVAVSLKNALPAGHGCIGGANLGAAQRASLDYFAGIRTLAAGTPAGARCRLLLMHETGRKPDPDPGAGWHKLWEGRRPGDRYELFRLFARG